MPKEYVLLNHEDGTFNIGYDKKYILNCLKLEIEQKNADLENFTLFYGEKKELKTVENVTIDYDFD